MDRERGHDDLAVHNSFVNCDPLSLIRSRMLLSFARIL